MSCSTCTGRMYACPQAIQHRSISSALIIYLLIWILKDCPFIGLARYKHCSSRSSHAFVDSILMSASQYKSKPICSRAALTLGLCILPQVSDHLEWYTTKSYFMMCLCPKLREHREVSLKNGKSLRIAYRNQTSWE